MSDVFSFDFHVLIYMTIKLNPSNLDGFRDSYLLWYFWLESDQDCHKVFRGKLPAAAVKTWRSLWPVLHQAALSPVRAIRLLLVAISLAMAAQPCACMLV